MIVQRRTVFSEKIVYRCEEIKHPAVRQQPVRIQPCDILAAYLADKCQRLRVRAAVPVLHIYAGILHPLRHIRRTPPVTPPGEIPVRQSCFNPYCHKHIISLAKLRNLCCFLSILRHENNLTHLPAMAGRGYSAVDTGNRGPREVGQGILAGSAAAQFLGSDRQESGDLHCSCKY